MSRLTQLGKDSFVYGFGGILAKSVLFLTLPIYTRVFTPAEYGIVEMLTVMSGFLGAILVMGMDSAQSMYFFKYKAEGKASQVRVVSAILQWRILWGSGIVLLAMLCAPYLNAAFFNGNLGFECFAFTFAGTLFVQIMAQSAEVMRLLYRPWAYISITLAQTLLGTSFIFLFVLVFDQGISGYFLGTFIASSVVALIGWFRARSYLDFSRLHRDFWPQLIRFGAPLLPASIAFYVMSSADRWFVLHYHGSDALGLFAVGAKFSLLMAFAVDTFRKAWWPISMDAMNSSDGPDTFRMMARLYIGLGSAVVVILTLFSPWLVQWFTAPTYHDAWRIVGILAWQALFYGFFLVASAGIWKTEKTYLDLYLMVGAAFVGLLLNWFFVPILGGIGAAVATVLTYILWVVATMIVSESLWFIAFPWRLLCLQISLGLLFSAWYLTPTNKPSFLTALSYGIIVIFMQLVTAVRPKVLRRLIMFTK